MDDVAGFEEFEVDIPAESWELIERLRESEILAPDRNDIDSLRKYREFWKSVVSGTTQFFHEGVEVTPKRQKTGDRKAMRALMKEIASLHASLYVRGSGAPFSCEIWIWGAEAEEPGRVRFFDGPAWSGERLLNSGTPPLDGRRIAEHLLDYPRTAENISPWMGDLLERDGWTKKVPVYIPELNVVEYEGEHWDVTDTGTDLSTRRPAG